MQTPERSPSPANSADDLLDFPSPPTLPFPPGSYTLLPLVDKADNGEIPRGPWEATDLKKRWEQHVEKEKARHLAHIDSLSNPVESHLDSSAVDDDDEDVGGESASLADRLDREFVVPFFVRLPDYSPPPPPSTSATPRRRSSSTRSSSFTPMTPIPSLRPSSPTSSHPTPQVSSRADSSLPPSQPVGFLRPQIVLALLEDNQKLVDMNLQPVWKFLPPVSYDKKERRPSYGSKPGSRRHSIKSLTPKPDVLGSNLTEEPLSSSTPSNARDDNSLSFSEIVSSLRALEMGQQPNGSSSLAHGIWAVGFSDSINESGDAFEQRNEHLDRVSRGWKMSGQFMDQLAGRSSNSCLPLLEPA